MLKTKLKTILIIFLVLILSTNTIFASDNDFGNHWASSSIEKLVNDKVISGYPDGSFKPDNPITRAEFITIINKIMGYSNVGANIFNDIKQGDWYYEAIVNAQNEGIVNGSNGMFRPLDKISRQEAVVILFRAYEMNGNSSSSVKFADDKEIALWAKSQVSIFIDLGIIKGRSETEFSPLGNLTRAEAVKLIDNIKIYLDSSNELIGQPNESLKPEIPKVEEKPVIPETPGRPEVPDTPETPEEPVTSETYTAMEMNGKIVNVLAGVYNIIFTEDNISYCYPSIKTTDTLNIKINSSISTNYDITYFDFIPSIDGPGWLAFNIQGASETDILNGIVSFR